MKQILIKRGRAIVEDVPAPIVEPGTVLVRVTQSCISIGTGKNRLPYINIRDVAEVLVKWARSDTHLEVFNLTPSANLTAKDWYRCWGLYNGIEILPIFVPAQLIVAASMGILFLKKMSHKPSKNSYKDIIYSVLTYSNDRAKQELG